MKTPDKQARGHFDSRVLQLHEKIFILSLNQKRYLYLYLHRKLARGANG